MKKGLILEGGAMRGMFTAGVIDVLMEHGIEFDGAIGVSAGAAFGCNYKSRQIGRVIRYNSRFCKDKRYCGIGVLLKTGNIYSEDFAYNEVPLKYDPFDFEEYEKNPMEFYVVCTDINTGNPVYHLFTGKDDHCFAWIRASSSMPLVSNIVKIDNIEMLDGGISDSIPVRFFESIGYSRNIVVLTRPEGYIKKPNKLLPLMKLKYGKYPLLIKTMEKRHTVYNETLAYIRQQEQCSSLLVIRPKEALPINKVEKNPDKLKLVYNMGREAALSQIDTIKNFIS